MFVQLKRAGPIVAVPALALVLVPAASSGTYGDKSGDNTGGAGDITGLTVTGDKNSGQLVFRIAGSNIATSEQNVLFLDIDSDANPASGNEGTEYSFVVDNGSYGFAHWDGSRWADTPYNTVRVTGGSAGITISVNRSELGNTADFNFSAVALALPAGGTAPGLDSAPDDGEYNFSFDANGPLINSVDVQTKPSGGPRAGKQFVVAPAALHLPPDGRIDASPLLPETYSCTATLGSKSLTGTGTGACTFVIPKKKAKGKTLTVQLTVNYQGASKVSPLRFRVR